MQQEGVVTMPTKAIQKFLQLESASGIILMIAAVIALIAANSPLDEHYAELLNTTGEVRIGDEGIAKPVLLWINDGLMAIFFLLIGLELKREILEGQLSKVSQIALPGIAALGGIAVPALIYVALNSGDSLAMNGWAIPAATDIAFALGILYLLGDRVPSALKLFLMTLAIFDDLAAIVIIAVFYSGDLSMLALALAGWTVVVLGIMNQLGIRQLAPYVLVGLFLWVFVLKSGVHATLAGVVLAFAIPLRGKTGDHSPLRELEHALHPWVAYGILPVFALANAGVSLDGVSLSTLGEAVPLGIAAGLFVGKQAGILGFTWVGVKLGFAKLPQGVNWQSMWGVAALGGIGFTMSLFIGSLAFEHGGPDYATLVRLGIIVGSVLSGLLGYLLLRFGFPTLAKVPKVSRPAKASKPGKSKTVTFDE
jgi:NhaA family Na+:H+ antiporter